MVYRLLFGLFFLSGFCGLLYQIVWLRLAFSAFGVVTPVISVVVSVFMLGLTLGSWFGGRFAAAARSRAISPIFVYSGMEVLIGLGAFVVPALFSASSLSLESLGELNSASYLWVSALMISAAIFPWCFAMGTTYPLMMAYIEDEKLPQSSSFSYLYLANVIGAMTGAVVTALALVETLGFRDTLFVGAAINFIVAGISCGLGLRAQKASLLVTKTTQANSQGESVSVYGYGILFLTGLSSMAMEVIWTRAFTPIVKTTIYAFALLLATYLFATAMGSLLYRWQLKRAQVWSVHQLMPWVALSSLLPLVLNDPHLSPRVPTVLFSIFPFCMLLGYLTPQLIDQFSKGRPELAGRVYAVNMIGCILGPLAAGYVFLPLLGVKYSLLLTAIPFLLLLFRKATEPVNQSFRWITLAVFAVAVLVSQTHEDLSLYKNAEIRRDYTATVIAEGEGMERRLLVNGIGITHLTPITKIMAHLPLGHLETLPQSALVICFGMGTTFRSLLSWDIQATAVELVSSVKDSFGFFFADADQIMASPKSRIVVDDGRRFLKRAGDTFDVVTLDPPPPVEAAGSSLLYSVEFYRDVKKRLKPGGILQQWYPGGEEKILHALARSLVLEFPYVRVFHSIEKWGYHFLASEKPIPKLSASEWLAKLPEAARKDLLEWYPDRKLEQLAEEILSQEIALQDVLNPDPAILVSDDRPYNEYFLLRRQSDRWAGRYNVAP